MNILYIGQYSEGTTSKMRADILQKLMPESYIQIIDTHIPFYQVSKPIRSLGFRFKKGHLIKKINNFILKELQGNYDIVWLDKAVYITAKTTKILRSRTIKLIHFTPDPAFEFHRSRHFIKSLPLYDLAVTTKSYELSNYQSAIGKEKVLYVTQGFDKNLHKPYYDFVEKQFGVSFIGHREKEREEIVQKLINSHIPVVLAGKYWSNFVKKNKKNASLNYIGKGIYGEDYAKVLSKYYFSLGLLSRWVNEQHTTRTFEIPACRTALITEKNDEISKFYNTNEVIYFNSADNIIERINSYMNHKDKLRQLIQMGYERVLNDGRDYRDILTQILRRLEIELNIES